MKEKYIELTNENKYDDIKVENVNLKKDNTFNKDIVRERKVKDKKFDIDNLTEPEMSKFIHSYDHPEIKDWPKRPYRTIMIVILLLFSGLLFSFMSYYKFTSNHTYDIYLPYAILGILLLFPGIYYTFILISIILGAQGYDYSELPDLNQ